jgi:hypothetical protein
VPVEGILEVLEREFAEGWPVTLRGLRLGAWMLLVALVASGAAAEQVGPFEWRGIERAVAVGDLHGHYDQMLALLEGAGLIDGDLDWTGGSAHLIICGDLIDRGPDDRAVLDLARKIQRQAEAAGGQVHTLLGNHEVMNLTGNYRYVARESFADFANEESETERLEGLRAFRRSLTTRGMSGSEVRAAFDDRFPPGYFGWARAFAPGGEYGSWLIEQPTIVKVNGRVFVHGGLTEAVAALGLEEINRRMKASVLAFVDNGRQLADEAEWPHAYSDLKRAAMRITGGGTPGATSGVEEAARRVLEASEELPFVTDGPIWYRGSSIENERLERRRIDTVLELLDAEGQVVGHTVTRGGHITSRFNGRLYRSDVGVGYGRRGRALVIAGGEIKTFNPASGAITSVIPESPQGEGWPQGEEELPDDVLERFLSRAEIKSTRAADFEVPVKLLELEGDGMHLRAIFGYTDETVEQAAADGREAPRRFSNTVAAYRLDRLMDLDLVPVTVPRRVEGVKGAVQIWIQSAWDQPLVEQYQVWSYLEGLETEVAEVAAFSALIGIADRVPAGRMLLPISRRILLADNSVSFPEHGDVDPYLPEGCGPVGPAFMAAVRSLQRGELIELFGDLVSHAAVDALMARRDELIERCKKPASDWSVDMIRQRLERKRESG